MFEDLDCEIIEIPRYCRALIKTSTEEAGITWERSERSIPSFYGYTPVLHKLTEGNAYVDIFEVYDDTINMMRSKVATILLFHDLETNGERKQRLDNDRLRDKIKMLLLNIKHDKRNHVVKQLEKQFLPEFDKLLHNCEKEFKQYEFNVWSSPCGSHTPLQGYNLGIECVYPKAEEHEAYCVAIVIGVCHISTEPKWYDVGVGWGAGKLPVSDSDITLDIIESPIPFNDDSLQMVEDNLHSLIEFFEGILRTWKDG